VNTLMLRGTPLSSFWKHPPCIIYQNVDLRIARLNLLSHLSNFLLRREVSQEQIDLFIATTASDFALSLLTASTRSWQTMTTRAPILASPKAVSFPMPELEPVTVQVFPCMSICIKNPFSTG